MKPSSSFRLWRTVTLLALVATLAFWGPLLWTWLGPVPPCLPPNLHEGYHFHDEDVMVVEAREWPAIDEFMPTEEEPRLINSQWVLEDLPYPGDALEQGIEGMVVARVLVDKTGRVADYRLIRRQHPSLDAVCLSRIPQMRFSPAKQGGKPIAVWVNVPFRFRLHP